MTATLRMDINSGEFKRAPENDFTKAVYSNSRGAQKNFSYLNSMTTVTSELFNIVPQSMVNAMNGLGKTSALAAPLCGMNEAVTFGIDAVRSYAKMATNCTMDGATKAFAYTMKCAQRVAESAAGIMKLGLMDAACMVGAKFFKDFFACIVDVIVISDATAKDQEIAQIAHKELREKATLANHFTFFRGVVGLTFHAMNLTGLLCSGVVTFYMVTVLATIFTATVLSGLYVGMQEDDLRNELALKIAKAEIKPLNIG